MHRFGEKQGLFAGSASRRLCNAHAVNSCSSGIRCRRLAHSCVLQRGAITSAANDEKASQEQSPKSYANRLQSNPAYQRLKALKQQPQEAGEVHSSTVRHAWARHLKTHYPQARPNHLHHKVLKQPSQQAAQKPILRNPRQRRLRLNRTQVKHRQGLVTGKGTDQLDVKLLRQKKTIRRVSMLPPCLHRMQHGSQGHPYNLCQPCNKLHMLRQRRMRQCDMLTLLRASKSHRHWLLCSSG